MASRKHVHAASRRIIDGLENIFQWERPSLSVVGWSQQQVNRFWHDHGRVALHRPTISVQAMFSVPVIVPPTTTVAKLRFRNVTKMDLSNF
jgi:hypothetical protein